MELNIPGPSTSRLFHNSPRIGTQQIARTGALVITTPNGFQKSNSLRDPSCNKTINNTLQNVNNYINGADLNKVTKNVNELQAAHNFRKGILTRTGQETIVKTPSLPPVGNDSRMSS